MGQKFCPLSFFSFYVNKDQAQAGGCHHCVEESCGWWDEQYQQCGIKSGLDAISIIADAIAGNTDTQPKAPTKGFGISGILSKFKRQPDTKKPETVLPVINPSTNVGVPPPPPPIVTEVTEPKAEIKVEDNLLTPPPIPISDLPIISAPEVKKEIL